MNFKIWARPVSTETVVLDSEKTAYLQRTPRHVVLGLGGYEYPPLRDDFAMEQFDLIKRLYDRGLLTKGKISNVKVSEQLPFPSTILLILICFVRLGYTSGAPLRQYLSSYVLTNGTTILEAVWTSARFVKKAHHT